MTICAIAPHGWTSCRWMKATSCSAWIFWASSQIYLFKTSTIGFHARKTTQLNDGGSYFHQLVNTGYKMCIRDSIKSSFIL